MYVKLMPCHCQNSSEWNKGQNVDGFHTWGTQLRIWQLPSFMKNKHEWWCKDTTSGQTRTYTYVRKLIESSQDIRLCIHFRAGTNASSHHHIDFACLIRGKNMGHTERFGSGVVSFRGLLLRGHRVLRLLPFRLRIWQNNGSLSFIVPSVDSFENATPQKKSFENAGICVFTLLLLLLLWNISRSVDRFHLCLLLSSTLRRPWIIRRSN